MEREYEDAREIYRHWWKDMPEYLLLRARYLYGSQARGDEFARGYHADILLAINDILRSRS